MLNWGDIEVDTGKEMFSPNVLGKYELMYLFCCHFPCSGVQVHRPVPLVKAIWVLFDCSTTDI